MESHRHGRGKYAREAYGSRKDCKECSALDAAFEKARKHYAEQARFAAKFTDGEPIVTDASGMVVLKEDQEAF